ncbi:MAG TPA: DUF5668 domain-containing protein [candidate division Zixibacteria bacterium]|nr:DUF5668 domain-containing protein [candidate division Zixibacteria bacterium]
MTPARFRWGLIFVTIGALLLLRNMGTLNDDFWIDLAIYFPVVLIAIGIEKIFTHTRFQIISYATSVCLLVTAFFIAFHSGSGGSDNSFFHESRHRLEAPNDVQLIKADLKLGETDLTIRDSGRDLIYSRFDRFTRKPRIDYDVEDSVAEIQYSERGSGLLGGIIKIDAENEQDWYVRFSDIIPLDLECTGHGSDIHLNLATTPLRRLTLDTDNARVYLKIGDLEPEVNVTLNGADSNLRLRVPRSAGLQVKGQDYDSYLDRLGLIEKDGFYITSGYDSLPVKVSIDVDEALSSFTVDFF